MRTAGCSEGPRIRGAPLFLQSRPAPPCPSSPLPLRCGESQRGGPSPTAGEWAHLAAAELLLREVSPACSSRLCQSCGSECPHISVLVSPPLVAPRTGRISETEGRLRSAALPGSAWVRVGLAGAAGTHPALGPVLGPALSPTFILASRQCSKAGAAIMSILWVQKPSLRGKGLSLGHRASKEELGFESSFSCPHILASPQCSLPPDPRGFLTASSLPPVTLEGEKPSRCPQDEG